MIPRLAAAFLLFVAALSAAPEHVTLLRQANEAIKAGDRAAALAPLEAAAKLRPDYPRLGLELARTYAALGRPDDALAALRQLADRGVAFRFAHDPALASLRELPAFAELAGRNPAAPVNAVRDLTTTVVAGTTGIVECALPGPDQAAWFLADVRHRCIWRLAADGTRGRFTAETEPLDGVFRLAWSADGKTLWATTAAVGVMTGSASDEGARSALIALDAKTGKVRQRIAVPADERRHLLGDFVFDRDGTLYATDSFSPVIWRLPPGGGRLEAWLEHADFLNLQGLALGPDGRSLYVADYSNGVWRIDRETKSPALLRAPANATFYGIDGLYAVKDDLYAVQNGVNPQRLLRIRPAAEAGQPSPAEILLSGQPAMTDLALGTLAHGRFSFVGNSGWALFDPAPETPPAPRPVTIYSFAVDM